MHVSDEQVMTRQEAIVTCLKAVSQSSVLGLR